MEEGQGKMGLYNRAMSGSKAQILSSMDFVP